MDGSLRYFLIASTVAHAVCLACVGVTFRGDRYSGTIRPPLVLCDRGMRFVPEPAAAVVSPSRPVVESPAGLLRPVRVFCASGLSGAKPAVFEAVVTGKRVFPCPAAPAVFRREGDSSVMIHPLLPFQLQLYFKDRQSVHLELMFKIIAAGTRRQILVRRKISSGNLEADLLCARYLGHYLFIEQARFVPNTWQSVRIDLSQ